MKVFRKHMFIAGICLMACLMTTYTFAQDDSPYALEDPSGLKQDLFYLLGYQMLATGVIYYSPEGFSGWSKQEKDQLGFRQWKKNIQTPVWDKDHWGVNYVLHPYWGSAYYIRGRERGFSRTESFWISVLFSTAFEFGFESFMEEPSIQDLIVTPVSGSLLGMIFEMVRKDEPLTPRDKLIHGLIDPLGAMNRKVNSWLGVDGNQVARSLIGMRLLRTDSELGGRFCPPSQVQCGQNINGVEITFRYRW